MKNFCFYWGVVMLTSCSDDALNPTAEPKGVTMLFY